MTTRRTLLALALLGSFLVASFASAQAPVSPGAFAQAVTYQQCSDSWAFACGQRTPSGQRFGTAHRMTHCTRYSFAANGTFTLTESLSLDVRSGRYRIQNGIVRIELLDETGAVVHTESLPLAADGATLGGLSRVQR